jgi:hypothetical protein
MILRRLEIARRIFKVNTQRLREKVLVQLQALFDMAYGQARNKGLDIMQREKWARVAVYAAQVMEGVTKGFDEYKFNEDLAKLEQLINEAKAQAGKAGKRAAELAAKPEGIIGSQGPC